MLPVMTHNRPPAQSITDRHTHARVAHARRRAVALAAACLLLYAVLPACDSRPWSHSASPSGPQPTAIPPIRHVVLIKLNDPADLAACQADARRRIAATKLARGLLVGTPVDIGRATVDGNYDLALDMAFDSVADYRAYLDHPEHQALVNDWKPKFRDMRVFDFSGR
jgi:hypothetical protein